MTYSQLFYEEAILESTEAVKDFTEKLETTEGFIAEFAILDPKIAQRHRYWKTLYQEKLDFFQSRLTELQSGFERHYGDGGETIAVDFQRLDSEVREIAIRASQLNARQLVQLQEAIDEALETIEYRNWLSRIDVILQSIRPLTHADFGSEFDFQGRFDAGVTPLQVAFELAEILQHPLEVDFQLI